MYKVIGLILTFFLAQSVSADDERKCPWSKGERLKIHATYMDGDTKMCAVEVSGIFWWDKTEKYKQTSERDIWFNCDEIDPDIRRGEDVRGRLSYKYWTYDRKCDVYDGDDCSLSPRRNCIANFELR